MSITGDPSTSLVPPPEYCCVNCSGQGTVSEIHIYSSKDVFERSITILDALCEIFASQNLYLAQNENLMVTMCGKCAESLSYVYQSFMNLLSLSTASCYLTKLLVQIDNWHFQKTTANIPDETYNLFSVEINPEENNETGYMPHDMKLNPEEEVENQTNDTKDGVDDEVDKERTVTVSVINDEIQLTEAMVMPSFDIDTYEVIATFPRFEASPLQDETSRNKGRRITGNVTKRRYFKCNQCPAKFIPIFELHEHILSVHESKLKSKCDKCPFTYCPEIIKFETHSCLGEREWNPVNKSRPFLCEICGARFGGERLLTFHTESVHTQADIRYKCHYCGKQVVDRHKLFLHVEIHASTKTYLCFECGKSFSQRRGLDKHLEIHRIDQVVRSQRRYEKDAGTFPCDVCNRTFSYKRNLQEHQRMHVPETNKFRCPICQKPHWAKKRLEKHIMSHTPKYQIGDDDQCGMKSRKSKRKSPFKCPVCHKEFKRTENLEDHQEFTHLNSHQCQLCGKSIAGQRNLDVHLRTHMSLAEKFKSSHDVCGTETRHRCQFCPKVYSSVKDLELHSTVHKNMKNYSNHLPHKESSRGSKVKGEYSDSISRPRPRRNQDRSPLLSPKRHKGRVRNAPSEETNAEASLYDGPSATFEEEQGKRAVVLIDRM